MKNDKTEEAERRVDGEGDSLTGVFSWGFARLVVLLLCNSSSIEDVTQGVKWKVAAELYEAAWLIQPLDLFAVDIFHCCWHVAQLAAELSGPIAVVNEGQKPTGHHTGTDAAADRFRFEDGGGREYGGRWLTAAVIRTVTPGRQSRASAVGENDMYQRNVSLPWVDDTFD